MTSSWVNRLSPEWRIATSETDGKAGSAFQEAGPPTSKWVPTLDAAWVGRDVTDVSLSYRLGDQAEVCDRLQGHLEFIGMLFKEKEESQNVLTVYDSFYCSTSLLVL